MRQTSAGTAVTPSVSAAPRGLGAVLRRRAAWIGIAIAALVGGCDSGEEQAQPPREPAGVRFSGESLPGTLYLVAGPDELNADVYRVKGALSDARRLTWNGRVSAISASRGEVVVADARGSGSDRVEFLNLGARDALPGRLIDPRGQAPDLSPSGRLTWSVPRYGPQGGNAGTRVYVSDAGGAGRRIAFESPRDLFAGWGPGERLAVLIGQGPELLLDPGTPSRRELDPGLPRTLNFETARDGAVWALGRGAVAIVPPGGRARRLRTPWLPLSWAPDGRSILAVRGRQLGLLSPADGSAREVGRVENGALLTAEWVR